MFFKGQVSHWEKWWLNLRRVRSDHKHCLSLTVSKLHLLPNSESIAKHAILVVCIFSLGQDRAVAVTSKRTLHISKSNSSEQHTFPPSDKVFVVLKSPTVFHCWSFRSFNAALVRLTAAASRHPYFMECKCWSAEVSDVFYTGSGFVWHSKHSLPYQGWYSPTCWYDIKAAELTSDLRRRRLVSALTTEQIQQIYCMEETVNIRRRHVATYLGSCTHCLAAWLSGRPVCVWKLREASAQREQNRSLLL